MNNPSSSSTSDHCLLDDNYRHWFLIPAAAILTILAFLNRRKSYKTEMFEGRPGVVIPIDFLDRNRNTIVALFGAITSSILLLVGKSFHSPRNDWWFKRTLFLFHHRIYTYDYYNFYFRPYFLALFVIVVCIEIAFLFYPIFGCLASHYRIIGSLLGFSYSLSFFLVLNIGKYQKCRNNSLVLILREIPIFLCQLFIIGKFLIVLFKEKKNFGRLFYDESKDNSVNVKLSLTWQNMYVRNIIHPRLPPQHSKIVSCLRKIINPHKYYQYSTHTLTVLIICSIFLFEMTVVFLILAVHGLNEMMHSDGRRNSFLEVFRSGAPVALIAAVIFSSLFCVISLLRFITNHKNNMLRMFKGDKSFIPKNIKSSQFMIGKSLRYQSFQIGYFLWGYFSLLLMFFLISEFFYCLKFPPLRKYIFDCLKEMSIFVVVAISAIVVLLVTSVTIFRDPDYNKNVISMNNRNAYLVFSYFWFFIGLPMGILSALSRILKAMIIGSLMLPRVDHSVLPDGFQQFDPGYISYIAYLHVQAAFRNPILRVFSQTIFDRKNGIRQWKCSPQARTRWFLALTLTRNPEIISYRKDKEKISNDKASVSSDINNSFGLEKNNLIV